MLTRSKSRERERERGGRIFFMAIHENFILLLSAIRTRREEKGNNKGASYPL